MIYEATELLKEILYIAFGDVVYEVGLKPLALLVASPFIILFLYICFRVIRRTILMPVTANKQAIDQIAIVVTENNRLLRALQKDSGETTETDNP
jgi:hypothetical protein